MEQDFQDEREGDVSENAEGWKPPTNLWEQFEKWHDANPHVWGLFVRFTTEAIAVGRPRFSSRTIIHRIRWYTNVETKAVDEYKINNNWSPYYARLFIHIYPQYNWLFELREVEEDPVTESRLVAKIQKIHLRDDLPKEPVDRKIKEKKMELFNIVAKPTEGKCEARRCKEASTEERGENVTRLWERKLVKLCDKHSREAAEYAISHPDYTYTPPEKPPKATDSSTALSVELQGHADEAQEIKKTLAEYEVRTQEDLNNLGDWLKEVKERRNWLETREKEITGPINLSIQKTRELFKPAKEFWANAEVILKQKIKIATLKEEDKNRVALQTAAEAHEAGDTEAAATAISQVTTVGDIPGISTRGKWAFTIIDAEQVPREFLVVDMGLIRRHCEKYTADQEPDPIPGVKFTSDVQVGVRSSDN